MDDIVDEELRNRQQMLWLLGTFAAVALTLSAMGIYSVLSYIVAESRREIGLRIAIGATSGAVVRAILVRSAGLTAIGLVVGLAGAAATTRWLGALLYGVSPVDPGVLAGVSLMLALVSLVASFLPAWRAASIDPMIALRTD